MREGRLAVRSPRADRRRRAGSGAAQRRLAWLTLAGALLFAGLDAGAQGLLLAPAGQSLAAPEQLALLTQDGRQGTLTVAVQFRERGGQPVDRLGWLLALPALAVGRDADLALFSELASFTRPYLGDDPFAVGCLAAAPDDDEASQPGAELAPFQRPLVASQLTTPIDSGEVAALHDWAAGQGFVLPAAADPLLADYLAQGWRFVGVRVELARAAAAGTLPPVALSFPADEPVWPWRLGSLAGLDPQADPTEGLGLRLYLATPGPVRAQGAASIVEFAHDFGRSDLAGYPALRRALPPTGQLTRLRLRATAARMTADLRFPPATALAVRSVPGRRPGAGLLLGCGLGGLALLWRRRPRPRAPRRPPCALTIVLPAALALHPGATGAAPTPPALGQAPGGLFAGLQVGACWNLATDWAGAPASASLAAYEQAMSSGTIEIGWRGERLELFGTARLHDQYTALGLTSLVRLPFFPALAVGAGVGVLPREPALELVAPRIDLRLPISSTWELVLTPLQLAWYDQTLFGAAPDEDELAASGYVSSARPLGRGLAYSFAAGLRGHLDTLGDRSRPRPLADGPMLRASLGLAPLAVRAPERLDLRVAGQDALGDGLGARTLIELTGEPGWRWGSLELGLPWRVYPAQATFGVGLAARWHPLDRDWLAIGGGVDWFVAERLLLIARLPQLELHYRWSPGLSFVALPFALQWVIEPGRQVWVERGPLPKIPYWGIGFGAGVAWGDSGR